MDRLHPASDALVLLGLVALPFAQALTLNVGFPLKISEVTFAGAAVVRLSAPRRDASAQAQRLAGLILAFFAVAVGTFFIAVNQQDRPLDQGLYRLGAERDGYLQLGYLGLALVTLLLVSELARRRADVAIRAWLYGACAASIYALYVNAALLIGGVQPPSLPGTASQVGFISGLQVNRAGTFLEGNFFGLYLTASLVLALSCRRLRLALVLSGAIIFSLSTPNVLAAVALWALVGIRSTRASLTGALMSCCALLATTAVLIAGPAGVLAKPILEKLSDPTAQSSVERRGSALAALEMFADYPLTGVGISQYGLWFPVYQPAIIPQRFLRQDRRFVPNNVYAQVAAEGGIILLGLFLVLAGTALRSAKRLASPFVTFGIVLFLINLNAFPSFTTLFLWSFFGLLLGWSDGRGRDGELTELSAQQPEVRSGSACPKPGPGQEGALRSANHPTRGGDFLCAPNGDRPH